MSTYYLSKIPTVTSIHPIVKKKYQEEVSSAYARSLLETPYLSDQSKIKTISYFDKKAAENLKKGVAITQKADEFHDKISTSVSKTPESLAQYELHLMGSGKKSRKNKYLKKTRKYKKLRKTTKLKRKTLRKKY